MEPKYKRVILKISGEALAGETRFGINEDMLEKVARQVKEVNDLGRRSRYSCRRRKFSGEAAPAGIWTGAQPIT